MSKIAVIGCGAIGLTTALELQERLANVAKVKIFADKLSPDTTSDVAAGLWEPYILRDNKIEDIMKWSKETYYYLLTIWKQGKAKEAGICLQPIINLFDDKNYELPEWVTVTLGYSELSPQHLESLSKQYKKTFTGGFLFISFTWEATIFLPYLQQTFLKNGGVIIKQRVEGFNELKDFDVIVNCTGLEARLLSNDSEIGPIRGQIIRVYAPWEKITYLINSDEENSCYIIPNTHTVVLGGTQQVSFNMEVSSTDSERIIRNTCKIRPMLHESKMIRHIVGLRPARSVVRLEEEFFKTSGDKLVKVVHNYGHGGAGITLCIGCAKEVASLVENILRLNKHKL